VERAEAAKVEPWIPPAAPVTRTGRTVMMWSFQSRRPAIGAHPDGGSVPFCEAREPKPMTLV